MPPPWYSHFVQTGCGGSVPINSTRADMHLGGVRGGKTVCSTRARKLPPSPITQPRHQLQNLTINRNWNLTLAVPLTHRHCAQGGTIQLAVLAASSQCALQCGMTDCCWGMSQERDQPRTRIVARRQRLRRCPPFAVCPLDACAGSTAKIRARPRRISRS